MDNKKERKAIFGKSKKTIALLTSLVLIIGIAVGGVIAFLVDKTDDVKNQFEPSKVTTRVDEKISNSVKSNVKIQNTGDATAWIRAAVVVTWQDDEGNVYSELPVKGKDYTIDYNVKSQSDGQWLSGEDGYYYWSKPVKSFEEDKDNCMTGILINECKYEANAPEGYFLTVEIISSGVQAYGEALGDKTGGTAGDEPVDIAWSSDKVKVTVNRDDKGNMTLSVSKSQSSTENSGN